MKKIKNFIILILLTILFVGIGLSPQMVFASTEDRVYPPVPDISDMGTNINVGMESSGLKDNMLASKLLKVYNSYYGLKVDRETVLRSNMFAGMDFAVFDGVLDLSNSFITTLEGLEQFNFSDCINLTGINLEGNEITSVTDRDFSSFNEESIKSLNLRKNKLDSFLVQSLTSLNHLNLSDNDLSKASLEFLRTDESDVVVNLSGNKFEKIEDISFNREAMLQNNFIHLYLINSSNVSGYPNNSRVKLYTGIVGLKDSKKYVKTDSLIFNKIEDLTIVCEGVDDIVFNLVEYDNPSKIVKQIKNSEISTSVNLLADIKYGKYMIYFTDGDGNSVSAKYSAFFGYYDEYFVEYLPTAPVVKVSAKEGDVEVPSSIRVMENTVFKFTTTEENAEVYYKMGQGEWIKATELEIEAGISTTLQVKVVCDGVESDIVSISMSKDESFGWNEMLAIGLIAIGGLFLFFVFIPLVRYFIRKPINFNQKKKKEDKEHL